MECRALATIASRVRCCGRIEEAVPSDRSGDDFDGVFYPGGHGPLWDLAEDPHSKTLIEQTLADGKPVALVCHAPAVLKKVAANDGSPFVAGKRVTGFTTRRRKRSGWPRSCRSCSKMS